MSSVFEQGMNTGPLSENNAENISFLRVEKIAKEIKEKSFTDPETRVLFDQWLDEREAWSTKENTVRSQVIVCMEQAGIFAMAGQYEQALEFLRGADDIAYQEGDELSDLYDLIFNMATEIKELATASIENVREEEFQENLAPEVFLTPSPAEGKKIRKLKIGSIDLPTSLIVEEGRFRLNGKDTATNEGVIMSGREAITERGGIYKINHFNVTPGLLNEDGTSLDVKKALLKELESNLKIRVSAGNVRTAAIYATTSNPDEVTLFLENGYTAVSPDSLDEETRRVLKISKNEGTVLSRELKQQTMECVRMAKELALRTEGFPFAGITDEAYVSLKEIEFDDPDHMYSVETDPLLEKFERDGMKLILAKDDIDSPNMYFLPNGNEDSDRSEESLPPNYISIKDDMDDLLKNFLTLFKARFGKK